MYRIIDNVCHDSILPNIVNWCTIEYFPAIRTITLFSIYVIHIKSYIGCTKNVGGGKEFNLLFLF